MKALVMEIRDKEAAVLDQEGIVRIVENQGYELGQEIEIAESLLEDNVIPFRKKHLLRIKTAAAIAVMVSGILVSVIIPSGTIKAKGRSVVTYKLNIWNRVIGIEADDQKGKEITEQIPIGLLGENIDDVMEKTFDLMEAQAGESEIGDMEFQTESRFHFQEEQVKKDVGKYQKDWDDRKEKQEEEIKRKDDRKDNNKENEPPAEDKENQGNPPEAGIDKEGGLGKEDREPAPGKEKEGGPASPDQEKNNSKPEDQKNPTEKEMKEDVSRDKADDKPKDGKEVQDIADDNSGKGKDGGDSGGRQEGGDKPGGDSGGREEAGDKPDGKPGW